MTLRRLTLIRHGETEGNSSVRFHGSGDVALSDVGREQMRLARRHVPARVDVVVASPLQRAWAGAGIVAPGVPVRLEEGFREIDFGRWEGLTVEEIEAADPALYRDWQASPADFEFPDGERRRDFRARVEGGLDRLMQSGVGTAVVVAHKGVVRTIMQKLCGEAPEQPHPELGEVLQITRGANGDWVVGPRSSNPAGVG